MGDTTLLLLALFMSEFELLLEIFGLEAAEQLALMAFTKSSTGDEFLALIAVFVVFVGFVIFSLF